MRVRGVKICRSGLNSIQSDIIDRVVRELGAHLVVAVAGAGKTRTIIYLIKALIEEAGIRPETILATTFTKKAANEMNTRLVDIGVDINFVRVGTFHSVCYEILRKDGHNYGGNFEILQDPHLLFKEIVGYKGMDWKGVDLTAVEQFVSLCKNALLRPDEVPVANSRNAPIASGASVVAKNSKFIEAYQRFEDLRTSRGKLTFDDMLIRTWELLSEVPNVYHLWQDRYKIVIVDEFQDTNKAQYELMCMLGANDNNIVVVGDDDQCQPHYTKIQTNNGERTIDSLSSSAIVRCWDRHSTKFSYETARISSRPFIGKLNRVKVGNYSTDATDNHKFLVRWMDKSLDLWAVYIMYKNGFGYGVGWCQLFNVDGALHFRARARLEKADKAWIVTIHDNKHDATAQESILSAKYGIPTIMFSFVDSYGAERCLKDYGMDKNYPFLPIPRSGEENISYVRNTLFPVYACNLIPKLMGILTKDDEWLPIENVDKVNYRGRVYSMDVERFHNYVSDGIVTLNSIYGWRGAVPEYMQQFIDKYSAKVHRMEMNYRSHGNILYYSNDLIVNNERRLLKVNRPVRDNGNYPTFTLCADMDDEAVVVADKVQELVSCGRKYGDFAVLYRTNAQSRAFEEEFIKRQIPHVVIGGTSFYNRKEIKDLLAYLRVVSDSDPSGEYAKRCVNTPFRFLGNVTIDKAASLMRRGSYRNIIEAIVDVSDLNYKQRASISELLSLLEELRTMVKENEPPAPILDRIIKGTNFEEWIISEEGTDTAENSRISNIRELIRTSSRFSNVSGLLLYIDNLNSRRKRKTETPDTVLLMTGHASKGLEFPVVFGVGWAERILPHARAIDIEEERRLAYVIATRAMDELFLSAPEKAYVGGGKTVSLEPSRFLYEGIENVSVIDRLDLIDAENEVNLRLQSS